jgi:hypothetical protein
MGRGSGVNWAHGPEFRITERPMGPLGIQGGSWGGSHMHTGAHSVRDQTGWAHGMGTWGAVGLQG